MATQYTAGLTAGQILTAATMNQIGAAWETWTPTLTASVTNPTLGTGSVQAGRYGRIQKTVFGHIVIAFGTAGFNQGSGFYFVNLPITAQNAVATIGSGWILDASTSLVRHVILYSDTVNRAAMWIDNTTNFAVAATNPWTWAANDQIRVDFQYEAA